MARYRYQGFVDQPSEAHLGELTLVAGSGTARGVRAGAERGAITARAVTTARDLCNTPATHLTAAASAEVAQAIGAEAGLDVEVFDEAAARRAGLRRACSASTRERRAGAHDQADVPPDAANGARPPRPRRQGDHVRLRRHQPQAVRRDARRDEARHVRVPRRSSARCPPSATSAAGPRSPATSCAPTTCRPAPPRGSATSSRSAAARPSRSSTPTPRAGSSWPTGWCWRPRTASTRSSTIATLTGAAMRTFGTADGGVLGNDRDARRPSSRPPATRPTSRSGELPLVRAYRTTARLRTSPTSRTWAARTPGRSPPACSSRSSSTACRSATSTSAGR